MQGNTRIVTAPFSGEGSGGEGVGIRHTDYGAARTVYPRCIGAVLLYAHVINGIGGQVGERIGRTCGDNGTIHLLSEGIIRSNLNQGVLLTVHRPAGCHGIHVSRKVQLGGVTALRVVGSESDIIYMEVARTGIGFGYKCHLYNLTFVAVHVHAVARGNIHDAFDIEVGIRRCTPGRRVTGRPGLTGILGYQNVEVQTGLGCNGTGTGRTTGQSQIELQVNHGVCRYGCQVDSRHHHPIGGRCRGGTIDMSRTGYGSITAVVPTSGGRFQGGTTIYIQEVTRHTLPSVRNSCYTFKILSEGETNRGTEAG